MTSPETCPECKGDRHRLIRTYDASGRPTTRDRSCPTCNQAGIVASDDNGGVLETFFWPIIIIVGAALIWYFST